MKGILSEPPRNSALPTQAKMIARFRLVLPDNGKPPKRSFQICGNVLTKVSDENESPAPCGCRKGSTRMASRTNRAKTFALVGLALLGTVGAFIFGVLAGEGGKGHLRNILLGVVCVAIPAAITAVNRIVVNKRALRSKRAAEQQTA